MVINYDTRLARALASFDPAHPLPDMWPQFDALASIPLMVIRGANSDLLSAATVEAMRARRAAMAILEIPDQGHAPLLVEADTITQIASFLGGCKAPSSAPLAITHLS